MPGGNQPDAATNNLKGLQDSLLGPDYNYSAQIKSPTDMGMSSDGNFDALASDIGGLMAYVKVLVTGKGKGSKTGQPLGTKFFLPTMANCTDVATGKSVKRSIYINNVPDGSIPFISQGMGGASFSVGEMKGLLPGIMGNLGQINPLQILQSFTTDSSTACQAITMETINSNNTHSTDTGYVLNTDIQMMNSGWFASPGQTYKPDTTLPPPNSSESFTTMYKSASPFSGTSSLIEPKTLQGSTININYSAMPDDFFIKLYLSSLGLLGLYIFLKMVLRKRLR